MRITLLLIALLAAGSASAAKLGPEDHKWIARCTANYMKEGGATRKQGRIYCTCMHDMVENNEPLTQSEMERLWPPMHLGCRRKAGRK